MLKLSSQLQSLLDNRLRYLPEVVGKAIRSFDWPNEIITIGKKYGIHIDEMEDFQAVVLKSMIGLIAPEQFESSLISTLAVSPTTAEKIIHDINATILEPIHDRVMHPDQKIDPLQRTGIVIETPLHEDTPTTPIPPVPEKQPFEIPASPEHHIHELSFAEFF